MKEVIKFARFYYELGYSLNEAITMAINIAREVEISKYEMGKTVPTIKNVTKIAESLKCTFGWNGNEFWFSQHKSKKKKRKKEIGIYDYWFD